MRRKLTPAERSEVARNASARPKDRLWKKHPTGICGIPECGKKHYMKDLCEMHWKRWKNTGSVGQVGPIKMGTSKTPQGHQPLIARAPRMPTKAAEERAKFRGMTTVGRERERRTRLLAACVNEHGERIPYTRTDDRTRVVYKRGGAEHIIEEFTVACLESAGLLFDNRAGVLVLTEGGKEAVSAWRVEPEGTAADGVGQPATDRAPSPSPMPRDEQENGGAMPQAG